MTTLRVEVPRKLAPLLAPARYKGAYGGRGGAKSHFFAEQLILRCLRGRTRAVCIREVQNSIKDSVRQLLVDKLEKLGVGGLFDPLETEIRGPQGSLIVFKGMQSYNADNIKSLEDYDIAWVEEAQTFSQHSLDLLRPTLRKDGSELWFSWNPRYKTDAVDKFFRKNPRSSAVAVFVNWQDNPWFPAVLHKEMLDDFEADPDKAEHIWNGGYGASQGAILAKWVGKAERDGRISDSIVYDPGGAAIEVTSDLGFRDTASWWFWQRTLGGFHLLRYEGASGMDAQDWIPRIQEILQEIGGEQCRLGRIWLPSDAKAKTFQSKHTAAEQFLLAFPGLVSIVPQSRKSDQINAARTTIAKCAFNRKACEDGIDGLMAWEFEWSEDNGVFSKEPLHNWASHPSDAYAYGCQVLNEAEPPPQPPEAMRGITVGNNQTSLDELWAQSPKAKQRI